MFGTSQQRLARLLSLGGGDCLRGGLKGLEKESLRVGPGGRIAQTPHPAALGAALTHPSITTDYSEALIELITPPFPELAQTLANLTDLHDFVYHKLDDELLWATSMPCVVGGDASIPIADYGRSNLGRFKHVYRQGLGVRYGRMMQAIAGVHFNYSLPPGLWPLLQRLEGSSAPEREFRSAAYFRLIRNFQRFGWLVSYLFGASPAVCNTFLEGRDHGLEPFDAGTLHGRYATSLRMSDIGYKNKAQATLAVSYDGLADYIASLNRAIATPDPDYTALGVCVDGQWRQLNGNILQIEAEYYSFIRPKAVPAPDERPVRALARQGVEYVEVRALDVNPFSPIGVDEDSLRVIETLLLLCLLEDSPPVSADEQAEIARNQVKAASRGRDPALTLDWQGKPLRLGDWAGRLLEALAPVALALDGGSEGAYSRALALQAQAVADPEHTPSGRVLAEMRQRGEHFIAFAMRYSQAHADTFRARPMDAAALARFEAAARDSLAAQASLESEGSPSFADYVARYLAS